MHWEMNTKFQQETGHPGGLFIQMIRLKNMMVGNGITTSKKTLYRSYLDIVAAAPGGEIAAFCTVWYHNVTRTGYIEPVDDTRTSAAQPTKSLYRGKRISNK